MLFGDADPLQHVRISSCRAASPRLRLWRRTDQDAYARLPGPERLPAMGTPIP